MNFYLGTHMPNWLEQTAVPLFVSRRRLTDRKTLPRALGPWALDSGGFTELSMYGHWQLTPAAYRAELRRYDEEIGRLQWAAPQDWMCEPLVREKTGLTTKDHQRLTVENFLALNDFGVPVIPVVQGWQPDDYLRCVELYDRHGVDLRNYAVVGVGSVCRRQNTAEAGRIIRSLKEIGLGLHGFGVKVTGLRSFGDVLASADSMAWSFRARRTHPLPGCSHKSCANCLRFALRWRSLLVSSLDQQRLEVSCVA